MTVKHVISEPWRAHFQGIQRALGQDANNIAILRGQIAEKEQMQKNRQAHAGDLIALICKEADLPEAINNYALSEDGCYLIGEIADPPPPTPSVPDAPEADRDKDTA